MRSISQKVTIPASANHIYDAFMDEKKHAGFTGAGAKIDNKVGGKFEVWDGYATGENIELIPGKKIVQTWRASDWPAGADSVITIILTENDGTTDLNFTQTDIPDEFADDVEQGWNDYYWEPLTKQISKNQ